MKQRIIGWERFRIDRVQGRASEMAGFKGFSQGFLVHHFSSGCIDQ